MKRIKDLYIYILVFVLVFITSLFLFGFPSILLIGSLPIIEIIFGCAGEPCWTYAIPIASLLNAFFAILLFRAIKRKFKKRK